jgi:uncharacterized protein with HEPN domain
MKDNKERDIVRLKHILDEISEIEEILTRPIRDAILESALERKYTIIGEACRAISAEMQERYKEVPWGDIIAMRNVLVHEYYRVEKETLWDVAENKIPALKDWIIGILEQQTKE